MLVIHSQEYQHSFCPPYRTGTAQPVPPMLDVLSMSNHHSDHAAYGSNYEQIAQALEIARESPDGAKDPTISGILESYLSQIWTRIQAHPNSYIMTQDEFAVFNFFQHRFQGNKMAMAARSRYWDNSGSS
ncbi:hypothetical protein F5Y15DRAFT_421850 [Xylariaceae sp. FL0016]|nr:hypothetical protein F5Y15DRAFT_421850 [Xylariaceae sp. FL0016]